MRLSVNHQESYAKRLVGLLSERLGSELADGLLAGVASDDASVAAQRQRIVALRGKLAGDTSAEARDLLSVADALVPRSVWIIGGDGWAYDIGYGGLDHVLASGENVNILVLDTEVYSNTGGQASKSTPRGAVAKFAAGGKPSNKKSLSRLAMAYENVYVAQIAMGAKDQHSIKAFIDAESYDGPSLIIAYSHCIAHGIDMTRGLHQQKLAVDSGYWQLFRFDPRLADQGENPFQLDSDKPTVPLTDYVYSEARYRMLQQTQPEEAAELLTLAQGDADRRRHYFESLATINENGQ
jgi:pyruvate-ferredoxin/flavodoxin oxidoreductase